MVLRVHTLTTLKHLASHFALETACIILVYVNFIDLTQLSSLSESDI